MGLTKNTAVAYAENGIRCNAIMPGGMETNVDSAFMSGFSQAGMDLLQKKYTLAKGMCDLSHVAATVLFLCSEGASAISGACMPVDRGWTAH